MQFFNTKEEVIDIQLTPYGKHLLSKGLWRPVYYEFYDDDIIYDNEYTGVEEKQQQIIERIKNTKRVKTQYTFKTPATGSFLSKESSIEKRINLYTNFLPLGNSSLIENNYPALKVRLLSGEIASSYSALNEVGVPNNINTLDLKDSVYTITDNNIENVEDISNIQTIYEDGTFIEIKEEEIFIELIEFGVDTKIENFDISIVELDEQGNEIRKIYFIDEQNQTNVVNNILFDNDEYEKYNEMVLQQKFETKEYVNHFLEINTDKNIDQNVICKYLSKEEILRLKIVEGYDIDCVEDESITTILSTNPTSLVTEEEA